MNKLLANAIDAHGGMERWKNCVSVEVDVLSGGELIDRKAPSPPNLRRIIAKTHEQETLTVAAGNPDRRVLFRPDRVAMETSKGLLIEERYNLRQSFLGHDLDTPWDPFQRAYFGGYALWAYCTIPFSLTMDGTQVWDIDPLEENGELWRGIRVAMPSRIAAHGRVQEFYFGDDMLLRRQDYTLEIADGFNVANYATDIIDVDGIKHPSKRRAYMCNKKYEVQKDRLMIWIDFSNFKLNEGI